MWRWGRPCLFGPTAATVHSPIKERIPMPKTPRDSFAFDAKDGSKIIVGVDEVYDDDHPYVRAYPSCFVDHDAGVIAAPKRRAAPVEAATAEPGETRDVVKPKK
jgi:hypothetical protein